MDNRFVLMNKFAHGVELASNLAPGQGAEWLAAAEKVVNRFSNVAIDRIASNVTDFEFHSNTGILTRRYEVLSGEKVPSYAGVAGFYNQKNGFLAITDKEPEFLKDRMGTEGIIAHELGHAVDGIGMEMSQRRDWIEPAWMEVLVGRRLSPYALVHVSEAFAEFCRELHTGGLRRMKKMLPGCFAFWAREGLVPCETS